MGGPGLEWNLNGNRNAKLQHWPFGALGSLYEWCKMVQIEVFPGPPPRGVWEKFLSALFCTTL